MIRASESDSSRLKIRPQVLDVCAPTALACQASFELQVSQATPGPLCQYKFHIVNECRPCQWGATGVPHLIQT